MYAVRLVFVPSSRNTVYTSFKLTTFVYLPRWEDKPRAHGSVTTLAALPSGRQRQKLTPRGLPVINHGMITYAVTLKERLSWKG